jgi:hypothetical protein
MRIVLIITFLLTHLTSSAKEGMWMPQFLDSLNEEEMQLMGMKISAGDIYSGTRSSLKDAVLQFGTGCTGEVISPNGLFITNYHCGYSQIQSLSKLEKNYLKDGFWAQNAADEIPCPGLTITFIRDIQDVTDAIIGELSDTVSEKDRGNIIKQRSDSLEKIITQSNMKGAVKTFYTGNKFFLFTTETFRDIRLVGAPPSDIGRFGGETDNWRWPRHTADFSMFRIYAGKDNLPADYATENIPYKSVRYFTINAGGIKENDFVFAYGFPGKTVSYIPASSLDIIISQTNPDKIELRKVRLDVWRERMHANDTVRLKYAAKFNTLENAYKKWQGELVGFERFDVLKKKLSSEAKATGSEFQALKQYDEVNKSFRPISRASDFYSEGLMTIEAVAIALKFRELAALCKKPGVTKNQFNDELVKIKNEIAGSFKNFDLLTDRKVCAHLLTICSDSLKKSFRPLVLNKILKTYGSFESFSRRAYHRSLFTSLRRAENFLSNLTQENCRQIEKDPVYDLAIAIYNENKKLQEELTVINNQLSLLQRKYMNSLMMENNRRLFPDANYTLRVTYGRIQSMQPADGINYNWFTTTTGISEKISLSKADYSIPEKLRSLIEQNDYGQYAEDGKLHTSFISSLHTTGGNSGSPVINSSGELIGINYDRVWEGVMSDYYYDESICRNIVVDIRYILFLIDKFAGAKRLIDEMNIVQ